MAINYQDLSLEYFTEFYQIFAKSLQELFPEYTQNTRDYFVEKDYKKSWLKKEVKNGRKLAFLAKDSNQIIGYLLVNRVSGGVSIASWIAVLPEYQGHGIATQLLKMWEQYSLENGAHSLQLWTTEKRVEFYTKRGFVLLGTYPQAWFGLDMPIMYKSLAEPKEENYLRKYLKEKNG